MSSEFQALRRVTSDCRAWPAGGQLGTCEACGTVQALVDDRWRAECREIYDSYAIYYQGGGAEQKVFDPASGAAASRSDQLLTRLSQVVEIPAAGRLVDVGCGNGNFLRAFSRRFPAWRLVGSEYDETHRTSVEAISGVESFFSRPFETLPGKFDVVSMIHVLEHIEAPAELLGQIRAKLNEDGLLIIELPLFTDNPFELLIADHATHYTAASVTRLLAQNGFTAVAASTEWIPKELSVVARHGSAAIEVTENERDLDETVRWLGRVREEALGIAARSRHFGIFGTSIGATWLAGELGDQVSFFVDEDSNRAGRSHLDRPIVSPPDIGDGSDVYVVLPPRLSQAVSKRLARDGVRFHQVPAAP